MDLFSAESRLDYFLAYFKYQHISSRMLAILKMLIKNVFFGKGKIDHLTNKVKVTVRQKKT